MRLIIGGAHQGKTAFVKKTMGLTPQTCDQTTALTAPAVNGFHQLVREILADGGDPQAFTRTLTQTNPDAVILCDEVGLGIVPLDAADRRWREEVGRCLCLLAAEAESVSRIIAGLEQKIK